MASLSIRDVYKTYPNGVPVLKGVDIEIEDGQFLIPRRVGLREVDAAQHDRRPRP